MKYYFLTNNPRHSDSLHNAKGADLLCGRELSSRRVLLLHHQGLLIEGLPGRGSETIN